MYNSEDTIWTNQQLYFYKDKTYNSNGFIDLTISNTTTVEFKYFTPPTINFKIGVEGDFNSQKHCLLNISKISDLINSWKSILNSPTDGSGFEGIEIKKRYNNDRDLIFKFRTSKNTNELCVIIGIFFNDSNFAKVIIPKNEFYVIIDILNQYKETYVSRCNDLKNQALLIEQLNLLKQISINTKVGPMMFQEIKRDPDPEPESFDTINQNDELDSFIGGSDMSNVKIPTIEVDEKKASQTKPTSKKEVICHFTKDVLKNDITVLEDILNSIYVKDNPIEEFINVISNSTKIFDRQTLLASIKEDDYKSTIFLSKLIFTSMFRNYIDNDVEIPSSFPLIKYKRKDSTDYTILSTEFALELLTIHAYLKKYRDRIELKTNDVSYTKSITQLVFRCFTDVLIFSHLFDKPEVITTSVLEKFDHLEEIGFFNKYNKNLEEHNLDLVNRDDIYSVVRTLTEGVLSNKGIYVNELHDQYYEKGKVRIQSKNNFSIEQIINVIVKLEYEGGKGNKFKQAAEIDKIIGQEVDDSIKILYLVKPSTKTENKKSNLLRFISKHENEIPETFKSELTKQIGDVGDKKYDIDSFHPPLKDLGDNIVKALHIWRPDEDPKITSNFNYFVNKVEESILTKSEIINLHILETVDSTSTSEDNDWGAVLGGI